MQKVRWVLGLVLPFITMGFFGGEGEGVDYIMGYCSQRYSLR